MYYLGAMGAKKKTKPATGVTYDESPAEKAQRKARTVNERRYALIAMGVIAAGTLTYLVLRSMGSTIGKGFK